ncbi:DUF1799 domain-containing protein [Thalassococcus sp. S3]|uniref:DUF1799 domain-containing protein n=1 Tax=Thalassococcus sp. S3 TaxID=2017482 RepID=UPI0010245E53|nr:DUF1799 domain-containing protein [Thalassococcus sp. S3]QBF31491.1 hypothetical protein CFI11_09720 [Thalassococcus sp. S3]
MAGRAWAEGRLLKGPDAEDPLLDQARRFGFDLSAEDMRPAEEEPDGVWPWHAPALRAYVIVQTQWRYLVGFGSAMAMGLDYQSARAGLEMAGIEVTPELFSEIGMIELGAREALNGDLT